MAVQAQYPCKALMPEFRNRARDNRNYTSPGMATMFQGAATLPLADEFEQQNANVVAAAAAAPNLLRLYNSGNYAVGQVLNGTVFSSDPESELTCNSRKRPREEDPLVLAQQQRQRQLQLMTSMASEFQQENNTLPVQQTPMPLLVSTGLQLSYDDPSTSLGSQHQPTTSTSGRSSSGVSFAMSLLGEDLSAQLQQQNEEIERLVRLQTDKLMVALEERTQRHSRSLLSVMEDAMMRKLREKESELENASRRNAELEERVKQLAVDKQLWQSMAKNNEAMVSTLKSNLEQVVAQCREQCREGFGDSEAGDAESCCYDDSADMNAKMLKENRQLRQQRTCRACRRNEISILLLPCRHLCLCRECESKVHQCPICHSAKDASVQIYMS